MKFKKSNIFLKFDQIYNFLIICLNERVLKTQIFMQKSAK